MSERTILAWLVTAVCFAGCFQGIVVLRDPKTGQTVECRAVGDYDGLASTYVENCVKAYKQAGYAVVGDSR